MLALGFSLKLLTLFGLILAIGIVVDDAIVVVENTQRRIAEGESPRDAARATMNEVASALIGTTLVVLAVFVPAAFVPGITGRFYMQFAVTISVATVISTINSLTLSPALAGALLRPERSGGFNPFGFLTRGFNRAFDALANGYATVVRLIVGSSGGLLLGFVAFGGLIAATVWIVEKVPTGFIPPMDQGYAIVVVQLPDGASLERTDAVMRAASDIARETPGVRDAVAFAGFSGATFTNASNQGVIFTTFAPFAERVGDPSLSADAIVGQLFGRLQAVREAFIIAIAPPSVSGVGNGGGFKIQIQDQENADIRRALATAYQVMGMAQGEAAVTGTFTTFTAGAPRIYMEIDRTRAQILNVPIGAIFETLSINLGSAYVNDFNAFGRLFQVFAQADSQFRLEPADIRALKVRAATGALVPLGTLVELRETAGPALVQRYNMLTSVPLQGSAAPGFSTGEALDAME
jgi:HAE1 family hydrophobic/amphiphilic exporter-1